MAPVLFLFLMSAAAETLESAWKQAGIKVLTVAHTPANGLNTGCVWGHTPRMYTSHKLTAYEIYQLLYVDDGAFPFPTRDALIKGLALMHSHLARFGLEVHIGKNGDPANTECVFFPPPQFFDDIQFSALALTDDVDRPWLLYQDPLPVPETPHNTTIMLAQSKATKKKKEKKETRESAQQRKIDAKYDALLETLAGKVANMLATCRPDSQMLAHLANMPLLW